MRDGLAVGEPLSCGCLLSGGLLESTTDGVGLLEAKADVSVGCVYGLPVGCLSCCFYGWLTYLMGSWLSY